MKSDPLPSIITSKAVTLGDEPAWSPSDIHEVIKSLGDQGYAVLGFEVWIPVGTAPKVWGWSEYDVEYEGDWATFIDENAAHAAQELRNVFPSDSVINLTWISESDFLEMRQENKETS